MWKRLQVPNPTNVSQHGQTRVRSVLSVYGPSARWIQPITKKLEHTHLLEHPHHPPRLISGYFLAGGGGGGGSSTTRISATIQLAFICEIMRREYGKFPIAREISDALRAKIACACGNLGPPNTLTKGCVCAKLACKSLRCLKVRTPFWTTLLTTCDSSQTHNCSGLRSIRATTMAAT